MNWVILVADKPRVLVIGREATRGSAILEGRDDLFDIVVVRSVSKAIATLPEKYRTALILRDIEDHSYEQIAQILDLSEGTVKSRINRARNLLREKLEKFMAEAPVRD